MEFDFCGHFNKGDPIPDWLLEADPKEAGARFSMAFETGCFIVKTEAGYFVLPDHRPIPKEDYLYLNSEGRVAVQAASVPVFLPNEWTAVTRTKGMGQVL